MLICSVCRSQNMDTAKFCGNCGSPFTQGANSVPASSSYTTSAAATAATSSLITCTQGHIYSSVYQSCPYCPQADNSSITDYETRVEDPGVPITAVDIPINEFMTQGGVETLFEPIDPQVIQQAAGKNVQAPVFTPTEVIPAITAKKDPAPEPPAAASWNSQPAEPVQPRQASMPPPPEPPRVEPVRVEAPVFDTPKREPVITEEQRRNEEFAARPQQPQPPPAPTSGAPESDRRTIVVADGSQPLRSSKGRIVGWLITYSHNPDGEDFRIYAGYNRIGANPVCDIVVTDDTVSGSHAIIVYRDGRCLIKDDLSRNGTFVNGKEIGEAYPLQSYDQVRIGNTYLTFISAQRIA